MPKIYVELSSAVHSALTDLHTYARATAKKTAVALRKEQEERARKLSLSEQTQLNVCMIRGDVVGGQKILDAVNARVAAAVCRRYLSVNPLTTMPELVSRVMEAGLKALGESTPDRFQALMDLDPDAFPQPTPEPSPPPSKAQVALPKPRKPGAEPWET